MLSQLRNEMKIKYASAADLRSLSEENADRVAMVIAAGYGSGALEGDDGSRRLTPTFRPEKWLLIDDEGQDLVHPRSIGELH